MTLSQTSDEIELDIDTLPTTILTRLYNLVVRPRRAPSKRSRVSTGTGTGGLKRKSMDEAVEAEKIRQLEERMRLFEAQTASGHVVHNRSSDESSSNSDSD